MSNSNKFLIGAAGAALVAISVILVGVYLEKEKSKKVDKKSNNKKLNVEITKLVDVYFNERNKMIQAEYVEESTLELNNKELFRLGLKEGSTWFDFEENYQNHIEKNASTKAIFLIRHGEGIHNVAERELGKEYWENVEAKTEKYFDAPLNDVGKQQCIDLNRYIESGISDGLQIEAIIVSPLTRAIETAKISLGKLWDTLPIYAVEMSRERFGKNLCDKRKSVSQLKKEFPEINFDLFMESEEDPWWTPVRETDSEIQTRISNFYNWILHTPWKRIVIVGHSSFMSNSVKHLGAPHYWPANGEFVPLLIKPKN